MKGQQRKYSKGQDAEWWQEMQGWGRQRKREGRGRRGKGGNKRESREPEGGGKERREGKERAEGRKGRGGVGRRGRERWREGGTERHREKEVGCQSGSHGVEGKLDAHTELWSLELGWVGLVESG